jgi:hypothetical protein
MNISGPGESSPIKQSQQERSDIGQAPARPSIVPSHVGTPTSHEAEKSAAPAVASPGGPATQGPVTTQPASAARLGGDPKTSRGEALIPPTAEQVKQRTNGVIVMLESADLLKASLKTIGTCLGQSSEQLEKQRKEFEACTKECEALKDACAQSHGHLHAISVDPYYHLTEESAQLMSAPSLQAIQVRMMALAKRIEALRVSMPSSASGPPHSLGKDGKETKGESMPGIASSEIRTVGVQCRAPLPLPPLQRQRFYRSPRRCGTRSGLRYLRA